jgi:hypothetical protein
MAFCQKSIFDKNDKKVEFFKKVNGYIYHYAIKVTFILTLKQIIGLFRFYITVTQTITCKCSNCSSSHDFISFPSSKTFLKKILKPPKIFLCGFSSLWYKPHKLEACFVLQPKRSYAKERPLLKFCRRSDLSWSKCVIRMLVGPARDGDDLLRQ